MVLKTKDYLIDTAFKSFPSVVVNIITEYMYHSRMDIEVLDTLLQNA